MLPVNPAHQLVDSLRSHAKLFPKLGQGAPRLPQCTNLDNLSFFQFGPTMSFTEGISAFLRGILIILQIIPQEQMGRSDTGAHVASVQNVNPRWRQSFAQLPRNPMCQGGSCFINCVEGTIPVFEFSTNPNPATRFHVWLHGSVFVYLVPKSLFKRLFHGAVLHGKSTPFTLAVM